MNYGPILSESFSLIWKNKKLWVFGFLAALGGGGLRFNGSSGSNFQVPSNGGAFEPSDATVTQIEQLFERLAARDFGSFLNEFTVLIGISAAVLLLIFVALIVLGIVFWLVSLVGRAGLITAVVAERKGEPIIWGHLLTDGPRYLWRLVGLKFTLYLLPTLLFLGTFAFIFGSAFFAFTSTAGDFNQQPPDFFALFPIIICGFVCIGIPVMIALQIVDGYAFRGIVAQGLGIVDSIKHGWRVGVDNLGSTIILGIIMAVIGFAAALVIALIVFIPVGVVFASGLEFDTSFFITLGVFGLIFLLAAMVINSFFVAFQSIAFSKLYLQFSGSHLREKGAEPLL